MKKIEIIEVDGIPCFIYDNSRCYEDENGITLDISGTPDNWEATFTYNPETGKWEEEWID